MMHKHLKQPIRKPKLCQEWITRPLWANRIRCWLISKKVSVVVEETIRAHFWLYLTCILYQLKSNGNSVLQIYIVSHVETTCRPVTETFCWRLASRGHFTNRNSARDSDHIGMLQQVHKVHESKVKASHQKVNHETYKYCQRHGDCLHTVKYSDIYHFRWNY
jgi:hypothetical protein